MALGEPSCAHDDLVRALVNTGDSRPVAAPKLGFATVGGLSLLLNGRRSAGREVARLAKEIYGVDDAGWDVPATGDERAAWLELLTQIPRGMPESAPTPEAASSPEAP